VRMRTWVHRPRPLVKPFVGDNGSVATELGVIAGLDPAIHLLTKKMDPRGIRAFTPVFAGYARG